MKNLKGWIIFLILVIFITTFTVPSNGQINEDVGELMGSIGFLAMTLDAYYEICFSIGKKIV